jgi:hypothetical protein
MNSLIFKNETEAVARRASSQSESGGASSSSAAPTRQASPDKEAVAKAFFFREFVTATQLSFLDSAGLDEFLLKPILACALAAMANRDGDVRGREASRRSYVEVRFR